MPEDELQPRLATITATLLEHGADHVIESVAELPELLRQL